MTAADVKTVLGASIQVRGEVSGDEDLMILGEFEGTVRLNGARLTVGPEARMRAAVSAQEVVLLGRLEGGIWSTGSVLLRAGCAMVGNIFATRLSVEQGAEVRGTVDPARASEPLPVSPVAQPAATPNNVAAKAPFPVDNVVAGGGPVLAPPPVSEGTLPMFSAPDPASFRVSARPSGPQGHMPAGLAAAVRQFPAPSGEARRDHAETGSFEEPTRPEFG